MENDNQSANHPSVIEVKKFMSLLMNGNYDELEKYNSDGDFELIKIMLSGTKKMQYRLNSMKYNRDKSVINLTIKQPDLSGVNDKAIENFEAENIDYDSLDPEEKSRVVKRILNKTIQEELESDDLKYFMETLDITYVKRGEDWLIETENGNEFFDVFMSKLR